MLGVLQKILVTNIFVDIPLNHKNRIPSGVIMFDLIQMYLDC